MCVCEGGGWGVEPVWPSGKVLGKCVKVGKVLGNGVRLVSGRTSV